MVDEERSPCITCERLKKNKNECADSCEKLQAYQESSPHLTLYRGNPGYYTMPGLQRTPNYRGME
jgi:hypothetical protein